jgi:two-component system, NarL family, sensor kinase
MPLLKYYCLLSVLSLAFFQGTFCQTIQNLDSLENVLKNEKKDTATLNSYLKKMGGLSGDNIEAQEIIGNWIIANTDKEGLQKIQAKAYQSLGTFLSKADVYAKATNLLTKATVIAERFNYYEIESDCLMGLANIYVNNEQLDKALDYLKKSLVIAEKNNYKKGIAVGKFNLGASNFDKGYKSQDSMQQSVKLKAAAIELVKELKDTQNIILYTAGLSETYGNYKKFDTSLSILRQIEPLLKSANNQYAVYYFLLGKIYNKRGKVLNNKADFIEAVKYSKLCVEYAKKYNSPLYVMRGYQWLAFEYDKLGDYKNANEYNKQYVSIHDSLTDADNFKVVADIQNRYDRSKKENEIIKLNAANKQKSTVNKILIASGIGLLLFSLLGYRNFKNKQKVAKQQQQLQQQKITELEKDKQLLAIDAMLKGQEEERSRIAKDLHDGLGGMLSGTKLSFINMKENLVLTPENAILFDKSLSMLDNTIADLRKVAHNLMPEALVKFGLDEAVKDFCSSIQSSSNLKVVYQQVGEKRKLTNTAEVFTYRIIQELVNNAVKHAGAKQIIVQLNINSHKLSITVEDDGKGFDINSIANSKGAGMDNIKYRVQYFNGTLDIVTAPGKGTSVNIELTA